MKEILKNTSGSVTRVWPERCDGMVPFKLALFDTDACKNATEFVRYNIRAEPKEA